MERVDEGAHKIPHMVVEANDPLKILRNFRNPTPRDFFGVYV